MKALKTYAGLAAALMLVSVMSACGSSVNGGTNSSNGGTNSSNNKIGVIFATFDSPYFAVIQKNLNAGAKKYGLHLLPTLSSNFDPSVEATNIRDLITEHVAGLIVNPSDSTAVEPSLRAAQAAHIPVVVFDTIPDAGHVYISVRADNSVMGAMACGVLGKELHGQGTIAEIEGDMAQSGARERAGGFDACMAKNYPKVIILKVDAHWEADQAAAGLSAIMASHPDLAGIYEHTGGGYLAPVEQVLKKFHRWIPAGKPGHMPFVSIDGEPAELQAIRGGYLDSTVSQPADLYGKYAVYYMHEALEGVKIHTGPTNHGTKIVLRPQGILEDVFAPTLVTKANVNDPNLWANVKGNG